MKLDSKQIAVGGLITALSTLILLVGGQIGIGTFAAPLLAGICVLCVILFADVGTAFLHWLASGLLALILSPDKELAVIYLAVLGWYPILKIKLDALTNKYIRCLAKFAVFNVSTILAYLLLWAILFGYDWNASGYGDAVITLLYLLMANVIFSLYDKALSVFTLKISKQIKNAHK